jgi:ribosomal protein S18 acetylase RimI-like enzyme
MTDMTPPFAFRVVEDHATVSQQLVAVFSVDHMMIMGRPYPVSELTVLGAYLDDELVGMALWTMKGNLALLAAVVSLTRRRGVARALLDEIVARAKAQKAKRLRSVTTNDNVDALKFYQLYGFKLTTLFVNALDMLRVLHPGLSMIGMNGIARRDVLELEMDL